MSWEHRGGRGRFYTRSHRENGKVVRVYVGSGPVAEIVAIRDEADRAARAARYAAFAEERQSVATARAATVAMDRAVTFKLDEGMLAAGYTLHARSTWRKTRMSTTVQPDPDEMSDVIMDCELNDDGPSTEELWAFLKGRKPSPPAAHTEGLARRAEDAWTVLIAGPDLATGSPLDRQIQEFRAGLGTATSPLEQLLIDQLVVCWLESWYFSIRAAETAGEDLTPTHREFQLRGIDRAQRRVAFLTRQLLDIRRILKHQHLATGPAPCSAASPSNEAVSPAKRGKRSSQTADGPKPQTTRTDSPRRGATRDIKPAVTK